MKLGVSIADYSVTIGGDRCDVIELYPDRLYCRLDNDKHHTTDVPKDVVVSI